MESREKEFGVSLSGLIVTCGAHTHTDILYHITRNVDVENKKSSRDGNLITPVGYHPLSFRDVLNSRKLSRGETCFICHHVCMGGVGERIIVMICHKSFGFYRRQLHTVSPPDGGYSMFASRENSSRWTIHGGGGGFY